VEVEAQIPTAVSVETQECVANEPQQENVEETREEVETVSSKGRKGQWVACKLTLSDESRETRKKPTVSVTPIRSQKRYKLLGMKAQQTQTGAMEIGVKHDVLLSNCAVLTALVTYFVERNKNSVGAKRGKMTRYALHVQASRSTRVCKC
jgi:hypothetical protein